MITDELMVYISIYSHLEFSMTTATAVVGELKGGAGTGSNPGVDTICGLSLLLVLSLAPRGFSPVLRFSPLLKNQHFQIPIRPGIR